jgi:hypothetical protein
LGSGRSCEDLSLDPLTCHLFDWFVELSDCRKFTVIAGPAGGGGCFPDPLSPLEILSWSELSGVRLTPWEFGVLKEMDRAWRLGYRPGKKGSTSAAPEQEYQALGEYCKGEKLDECRRSFGAQLDKICATCPN